MKKTIIITFIFLFLAGCTCKVRKSERIKELSLEEIPEEIYPPEKNYVSSEGEKSAVSSKNINNISMEEGLLSETIILPELPHEKEIELIESKDKSITLAKKEEKEISTLKLPEKIKKDILKKKQDKNLSNFFNSLEGECLIYKAKWNFINIGKGIIICKEEKNGYGDVYHFVGITIPEGTIAKMGYGYNRVDSFVDKKTLNPYYFYSYVKSGNKERITEIYFNSSKNFYKWSLKKFKNGVMYSKKSGNVKFNSNLYDGMYVFYVIRNSNFDKNKNFQLPIAMIKIWNLIVKVKGKQKKIVPLLGNKNIYIIEPIAKSNEGVFRKGKMTIWITDDKERIPVYFEGKVPLGTAKLSLVSRTRIDPETKLNRKLISSLLSSVE